MKRSVVWILRSCLVLGLAAIPVRAQETNPERETLVVAPGNDFRAALEKGVRLKAVGQPITAKPQGSPKSGHVGSAENRP